MVAKRQQDLVLLLSGIPVKVRVTRCSVEHLPPAQLKIHLRLDNGYFRLGLGLGLG